MAVGSDGLNTPNDQQRAIAVQKAEQFAAEYYTVASTAKELEAMKDNKDLAAQVKPATDFMGKLTKTTKPVFFDVYNASVTILAANATPVVEEAVVEEVVEAPAVEETVATEEVVEAPVVEEVVAEAPVAEDNAAVLEAEATLAAIKADTKSETRTSPYWLIFTYLILTFAELLLSPMGISFVSKVAPPKLKGLMMGGWFVATAIGNMLVAVGGFLWAGLPLWSVWTVFVVLCLLSALFMFVMMKRLESVTK